MQIGERCDRHKKCNKYRVNKKKFIVSHSIIFFGLLLFVFVFKNSTNNLQYQTAQIETNSKSNVSASQKLIENDYFQSKKMVYSNYVSNRYEKVHKENVTVSRGDYKRAPELYFPISDEERDILCRLVEAEAGGEPFTGKLAVANVVLNRLKSDNFPNTIKEVVYQKGQFSPAKNGALNKSKASDDSKKAVSKVFDEGYFVFNRNVVYFLNEKIASNLWIPKNKEKAIVIGNHSFYYN